MLKMMMVVVVVAITSMIMLKPTQAVWTTCMHARYDTLQCIVDLLLLFLCGVEDGEDD